MRSRAARASASSREAAWKKSRMSGSAALDNAAEATSVTTIAGSRAVVRTPGLTRPRSEGIVSGRGAAIAAEVEVTRAQGDVEGRRTGGERPARDRGGERLLPAGNPPPRALQ